MKEMIYYCYELNEETMDEKLKEKVNEFTMNLHKKVNPSKSMVHYLTNQTVEEYMEELLNKLEEERVEKEKAKS